MYARKTTGRALSAVLALLLALACAAPALAESYPYWGYAYVNTPNGSVLNLRAGPSVDEIILVGIPYGEQVALLDDLYTSGWVRCEYAGFSGYAASNYLSYEWPGPRVTPRPMIRPTPRPTATPASRSLYAGFRPAYYIATVTPSRPDVAVHMRYGPSQALPVLRDYPAGATLHVYWQNDTWSQVLDPEGHVMGYMMTAFLTYVEPLVFDDADGLSPEETQLPIGLGAKPVATPIPTPIPTPTATPAPPPQTDENTNG